METFSALLALFAGSSPVTRSFDIFFDLRLNKWLRKQSWGWWFETPSRPLWRHCNGSGLNNEFEMIQQCTKRFDRVLAVVVFTQIHVIAWSAAMFNDISVVILTAVIRRLWVMQNHCDWVPRSIHKTYMLKIPSGLWNTYGICIRLATTLVTEELVHFTCKITLAKSVLHNAEFWGWNCLHS